MANAILQDRTTRRTLKAAGIVTRQEVTPLDDMPGLFQVRDSRTGSGAVHIASAQ